ncbi:unnamed protein product [Caenorhabditis auriculariae]|uniref:Uncharacterized protein n=1 Tax=Caenorhabditis auriculariae TaxID=2777116 RepID=A0A8S1GRU1_9PELO|nr:unnamed protein product [Caenorhabditis auriculariae]
MQAKSNADVCVRAVSAESGGSARRVQTLLKINGHPADRIRVNKLRLVLAWVRSNFLESGFPFVSSAASHLGYTSKTHGVRELRTQRHGGFGQKRVGLHSSVRRHRYSTFLRRYSPPPLMALSRWRHKAIVSSELRRFSAWCSSRGIDQSAGGCEGQPCAARSIPPSGATLILTHSLHITCLLGEPFFGKGK